MKGGYQVSCSSANECDETKGLTECTSSKCDCPNGFYYDTNMNQCSNYKFLSVDIYLFKKIKKILPKLLGLVVQVIKNAIKTKISSAKSF